MPNLFSVESQGRQTKIQIDIENRLSNVRMAASLFDFRHSLIEVHWHGLLLLCLPVLVWFSTTAHLLDSE